MQLPADDGILLSMINMKLRDMYDSLDALCDDLELDRAALEARFAALGVAYDAAENRVR